MNRLIKWCLAFAVLVGTIWGVAYWQKSHIAVNLLDSGKPQVVNYKLSSVFQPQQVEILAGTKGTMVHFWATWCPPCVAELPELIRYAANLPEGFKVYVIANDAQEKVARFLKRFNVQQLKNVEFLVDQSGEYMRKLGTFKLPETYIYNSAGEFVTKFAGANNWKTFKKNLGL